LDWDASLIKVICLLFSIHVLISLVTSARSAVVIKSDMGQSWYLLLEDSDPLFKSSKPVKSGFLQCTRALIFLCMSPSKLSKFYKLCSLTRIYKCMMKQPVSLSKLDLQNWLKNFGQLEIFVSDKTGTLTCDHMELQIWLKNFDRLAENGRA